MILLLNPMPPLMIWRIMDGSRVLEGKSKLGPEFINVIVEAIDNVRNIKGIGYVLYNGGDEVRSTMQILDPNSLQNLESCIKLLPEYNNLTYNAIRLWSKRLPSVPHILFCDTGFFTGLPQETSLYAVPYELSMEGIKRYGGHGIYHQYALECVEQYFNLSFKRIISVYIGNNTNIAAIKDGIPLDTTIGFTPVEGIFSNTGCGDIDPTIVFQLYSIGISFEEINNILSKNSGFTGLLGKKSSVYEVLANKNKTAEAKALKIFIYDVLKYIGAYISILNGVDLIIFNGNFVMESAELISEICNGLKFIGVNIKPYEIGKSDFSIISEVDSKIKVICINSNRWDIMHKMILSVLNNLGVK
jgi:acetate kinase